MTSQADKNRRTSYTIAQARKKVEESVGGDRIEIFVEEGGDPFYIPHPYFYDKATKKALKAAAEESEKSDEDDDSAQSRILLGEQYDRYVAAGGTDEGINFVMIAVGQDLKDSQGN
ncbi:hypothetical protein DEJ17_06480 [Curtobacterium sp. MCSS17_011]|uniref:hypothetical protein n=1 Tax=Curtobacterium sp. MCSS17_011 TaxID=2175643 RepID=UPI000D8631A7|nr:hypothetical protein [Curtobacterium sp. MCSS17_011]PYY60012.1 hypothetical protein DEJ17_06480 [Curtobacterium sp. MCSS17_011]